jgi:hypothetical protein
MRLTKQEQETIINFNQKEDIAYIYTCSKPWMTHMEKRLGLIPTTIYEQEARAYEFPKAWMRKPRKPRKLSNIQKARLCRRLPLERNLSSKTPCAVGENKKSQTITIPST